MLRITFPDVRYGQYLTYDFSGLTYDFSGLTYNFSGRKIRPVTFPGVSLTFPDVRYGQYLGVGFFLTTLPRSVVVT
jgi:hypothetical protein